jgi:hypothetical protein
LAGALFTCSAFAGYAVQRVWSWLRANDLKFHVLRLLLGVESVHRAYVACASGVEHVIKPASGCFKAVVGVTQGHGNQCWCAGVDFTGCALGVLFGLDGLYAVDDWLLHGCPGGSALLVLVVLAGFAGFALGQQCAGVDDRDVPDPKFIGKNCVITELIG